MKMTFLKMAMPTVSSIVSCNLSTFGYFSTLCFMSSDFKKLLNNSNLLFGAVLFYSKTNITVKVTICCPQTQKGD